MLKKSSKIDVELVHQVADLLRETGLTELEVETKEVRIRASLGGGVPAGYMPTVAVPGTVPAAPAAAPATAEAAEESAPEVADADHPGAVTSPMVGTAYLSPDPDSPAFVQPGDTVKEGQTLLIIEAMKVMNQIPAPKSGTLKKVVVENSQAVEYGDPLVIIE